MWQKTQPRSERIQDAEPSQNVSTIKLSVIAMKTKQIPSLQYRTVNDISKFMKDQSSFLKLKCLFDSIVMPLAPHICEEIWQKLGHQDSTQKSLAKL